MVGRKPVNQKEVIRRTNFGYPLKMWLGSLLLQKSSSSFLVSLVAGWATIQKSQLHFFAGDDAMLSFPIFARMREMRPAASLGLFESLLRRKTSASWIASDFCKYIHVSLSKSINPTEMFHNDGKKTKLIKTYSQLSCRSHSRLNLLHEQQIL